VKFSCYKKDDDVWAAHMVDTKTGKQYGPEVVSDDPEMAVFKLGMMYGAHPSKFSRSIDELIESI
jgi:hypothetical protein